MQGKDDVQFSRPEYLANLEVWRLVSDACAGQHAVKMRGELYLPRPNPGDKSKEADERYKHYLLRAVYYNITGRTLSGLIGMAFGKMPEIKLPPAIKYAQEDVDGSETPLVQQAMEVMSQVLKTSRAGLLVDFPPVEGGSSVAAVEAGESRATINFYPAQSIINWRTERMGGSKILTLVVLREVTAEFGEWSVTVSTQYRVLRLAGGIYSVEIWKKDSDGQVTNAATYVPLDGSGKPWDCIPFAFVGAVQNTPELDAIGDQFRDTLPQRFGSPLYDLAAINLAHYRNSADFEDSAFLCGQPQPFMAGLDVEWRDKLLETGTYLGSRTVIPLPHGGTFGIAQAAPNTLIGAAMKAKEDLMVGMGAKLIELSRSNKTATQALHDASKDNSILSLVCDNVSLAYRKALNWVCIFMGAAESAEFNIDTEFSISSLDAQSITAVVQAWQAGAIPDTQMYGAMRKFGVIDPGMTDDEIKAELDAQAPRTGLAAALAGLKAAGAAPPQTPEPAAA